MSSYKGAAILACAVVAFAVVGLSGSVGVGGSAAAADFELQTQSVEQITEPVVEEEPPAATAGVGNVGNDAGPSTGRLRAETDGVTDTNDAETGSDETNPADSAEPFETVGASEGRVDSEPAGTLVLTAEADDEDEGNDDESDSRDEGDDNDDDDSDDGDNDDNDDGDDGDNNSEDDSDDGDNNSEGDNDDSDDGDDGDNDSEDDDEEPASAEFDVTAATLSEPEITVGDVVTVTATVENTGDADGTYSAELAIDDTVEESKSVDVDAGEKATVEFTPSFDEAGTYGIAVSGESAGSLTVAEPAAFEVSSAQLTSDTVLSGDDAAVSAEVRNVGGSEGAFTAEFRATDQDGTTRTVDTQSVTVAGGESRTVELRGAIDQPGEYDVQINQTAAGTLTVEAPAELAVTGATIEDSVVSVDDEVTVSATVENTGDREGRLSVAVAADGAVRTETEVTLGPGEQSTEQLVYTAPAAGEYEITVNGSGAGTLIVVRPATFRTTNVAIGSDRVLVGESTEVTATVVNVGTEPGTHNATLVVDGESLESQKLDIDPGGSEQVVFSPSFETAAEYSIAVDDEPAGTLSVLEPANVSIREVTLSSERIVVGESATVTVELANDGDLDGEFTTQLRAGNDTVGTDTRTVGPDSTERVELTRRFETTGDYELTVNGDPVGTLAVLEPADVSLGETAVASESIEVDDPVELTVELRNDGEATGRRDVNATFGDGSTVQRTPDVPADGTTLTVSHTYNATGEYTVSVNGTAIANVTVVEPQNEAGSGSSGGGGGSSGSSGSSGSAATGGGSSGSLGSAETGGAEPAVDRSESKDAVTISVDGVAGERYDVAVDLAGPSDSQPAVSVSSVGVSPASSFEPFEATIGRPAAEPNGRDPVARGVTLGYMEFNSSRGTASTSPATLQFTIDEGAIPRGLDHEDVTVMQYTDGEWTTANVTHEIEGGTHTATLPHAAPVAVVALEPGRVDVVEGAVPVDRVRAGYETTLRATVDNPGDRQATRNLTVTVDGEPVAEREVALDPGENATVEITFEPRESGPVSLEGEEVGSVELLGDSDGAATSADSRTDGRVPGFGVVVAVFALLVTARAWGRRS